MLLRVDRKPLLDAAKAVRVAAGGGGFSVIEGVRLELTESALRLSCTNIELTVEAVVDGATAGKGTASFVAIPPAARFASFLAALDGGEVTLELVGEDLTISSGSATAVMRCFREDLWPRTADVDGEPVELTSADVDLIERILYAVCTAKERPALCCVHFDGQFAYATDSYRLARAELSVEVPKVSVPLPVMALVTKATSDGVKMALAGNLVRFEAGDRTWTSTTVSAEFPNVAQMFEAPPGPFRLAVSAEQVRDAITRARTIDTDKLHKITLGLDGEVLRVTNASTDVGETAEELPATGDVDFSITFDSGYLDDLLDAHNGVELELRLSDPLKPCRADGDRLVQLVMPLRAPA